MQIRAAQGNSIRAVVKYIRILPLIFPGPEISSGTPLVDKLDADLKPSPDKIS